MPEKKGILNLDQLTLAAMLARRPHAVDELDRRHNHNLGLRAILPEPQRSYELADLVSVHHHGWFNRWASWRTCDPGSTATASATGG